MTRDPQNTVAYLPSERRGTATMTPIRRPRNVIVVRFRDDDPTSPASAQVAA